MCTGIKKKYEAVFPSADGGRVRARLKTLSVDKHHRLGRGSAHRRRRRGKKAVIFALIAACLPPSKIDKLLHGFSHGAGGRGRKDVKQRDDEEEGGGEEAADDGDDDCF